MINNYCFVKRYLERALSNFLWQAWNPCVHIEDFFWIATAQTMFELRNDDYTKSATMTFLII